MESIIILILAISNLYYMRRSNINKKRTDMCYDEIERLEQLILERYTSKDKN